ncbi:sigma factor-like helix-turn-helix DNA-binding protein [Paenibacillus aceti]|uniref:sigma factor-like helix-turn-helix DNA-binding protein n=1 Tax=Paenibacillus aceti TaxID=1820010 RepID=UPI000EA0FA19|nr:sigma factor-like helix-turn-helix DNA-binding protein [Paenibacillus aceti]HBF2207823.1 sigma-70 family RNA polymerase sigma factor [Clostridioides difficile]
MDKRNSVYECCKSEIYRIGWRVQYKAKRTRNQECPFYENNLSTPSFSAMSEEKIYVEELINSLPPQGKIIIDKLYLQGLSEVEVARQLNISQQAVNKWKRKMILQLSQMVNY